MKQRHQEHHITKNQKYDAGTRTEQCTTANGKAAGCIAADSREQQQRSKHRCGSINRLAKVKDQFLDQHDFKKHKSGTDTRKIEECPATAGALPTHSEKWQND